MINDIYIDNDRLIISAEKFYDNLKLLKDGDEQFKNESKIRLNLILEKCEQHLLNRLPVVFRRNNGYEAVYNSKDELIEWLKSKENIELGSKNLNYLNKNFVIDMKK